MLRRLGELAVPRSLVRWPILAEAKAQVRQAQAASQASQIGLQAESVQPISQNMPQPVKILNILTRVSGISKILTIHFLANPQDPFVHKVNVHLQTGNGQPVQIGSGFQSPIRITVPRGPSPGTIILQAEGNWGPHPFENSPRRVINLL